MKQSQSSKFTLATSRALQDRLQLNQLPQSHVFKSTSRDKKPTWTHRFVKDSYDLNYDTNQRLTKRNSQIKLINYDRQLQGVNVPQLNQRRRPMTEQMKKQNLNRFNIEQTRDNQIGGTKDNYYSYKVLARFDGLNNLQNEPITIQVKSALTNHEVNNNKFGLSDFEHAQKTIIGQYHRKQRFITAFGKKTARQFNIKRIKYDRNLDNQVQAQKYSKTGILHCHSFKSYSSHKAFEPRQSLDKFYEVSNALRFTTPAIREGRYDISKFQGRKSYPKKEGTQLEYRTEKAYERVKQKIIGYKLATSERKLQFPKQVINPQRGCAR